MKKVSYICITCEGCGKDIQIQFHTQPTIVARRIALVLCYAFMILAILDPFNCGTHFRSLGMGCIGFLTPFIMRRP